GERVLASGHRHEHGLVGREHLVLADGLRDLLAKELLEIGGAEGGVVAGQLDDCARSALAALHLRSLPPDITGRTSSSSPSPTTSSAVRRSLPRITSTVPGRMSSSLRTSFTRLRPANSTSRLGLRSFIFTRWEIPARTSRRAAARGECHRARPGASTTGRDRARPVAGAGRSEAVDPPPPAARCSAGCAPLPPSSPPPAPGKTYRAPAIPPAEPPLDRPRAWRAA